MDENNPLFDLCKIRIELIFLNEKNISNVSPITEEKRYG